MLPLSFKHGEFWASQPRCGNLHEDQSRRCGQRRRCLGLLWILRSYLSHRCVFVYALFISANTSGLVSCSCHSFYSLSWHFSQGFISHFLFQLLKFLSPASWGSGCIEKVIRILTAWRRKPDAPGHHSFPISARIQGTSESCPPPGACPPCGHEGLHF